VFDQFILFTQSYVLYFVGLCKLLVELSLLYLSIILIKAHILYWTLPLR